MQNLTCLSLVGCLATQYSGWIIAQTPTLRNVRRLDLSDNPLNGLHGWDDTSLKSIESLRLRGTQFLDQAIPELVKAPFWPNLVELDLRDNPLTGDAAKHFLAAPRPANLMALLLNDTRISADMLQELQRHFGNDVVRSYAVAC